MLPEQLKLQQEKIEQLFHEIRDIERIVDKIHEEPATVGVEAVDKTKRQDTLMTLLCENNNSLSNLLNRTANLKSQLLKIVFETNELQGYESENNPEDIRAN